MVQGPAAPQKVLAVVVVEDVAAPDEPIRCKDTDTGLEFVATAWNVNGGALPVAGDTAHLMQSSDGEYVCIAYGVGTLAGTGGGDASFVFEQGAPALTWTIPHTLAKYPSVTIVDSGGTQVDAEVIYDTLSQVTVSFVAATSGKAYLN